MEGSQHLERTRAIRPRGNETPSIEICPSGCRLDGENRFSFLAWHVSRTK